MHIFKTYNCASFNLPYIIQSRNKYHVTHDYYGTALRANSEAVLFKINRKSLSFLEGKSIYLNDQPCTNIDLNKIYHATKIMKYKDCFTSLKPEIIANMVPIEVPGVIDFSLINSGSSLYLVPIEHNFDLSNLPSGSFTVLKLDKDMESFSTTIAKRSAKASFSPGTFVLVKRKMKVFTETTGWQLIDYLYLATLKKCKHYYYKIVNFTEWIPVFNEKNSPLNFRNSKTISTSYHWNKEKWNALKKKSLKPPVVLEMKDSVKAALSYYQRPSSIRVQRLKDRFEETEKRYSNLKLVSQKDLTSEQQKEIDALFKLKLSLTSAIATLEEKETELFIDEDYIQSLRDLGIYISNLTYKISDDEDFGYCIDRYSFENKKEITNIVTKGKILSFDINLCLPYKVHLGIEKPIAIGPLRASYRCSLSYGSPSLHIEEFDALSCLGINQNSVSAIPHSMPENLRVALDEPRSRYVCMGELIGTALIAESTNDLRMLLMSILTFFASVNKVDTWGKNYKYFPEWGFKTNPISSGPKKINKPIATTNFVYMLTYNSGRLVDLNRERFVTYISSTIDSNGTHKNYLCIGIQKGNLIYRTNVVSPVEHRFFDQYVIRTEGNVFTMNIFLQEVLECK